MSLRETRRVVVQADHEAVGAAAAAPVLPPQRSDRATYGGYPVELGRPGRSCGKSTPGGEVGVGRVGALRGRLRCLSHGSGHLRERFAGASRCSPGGQQPEQLLPGPHALAQPRDPQELVGRVQQSRRRSRTRRTASWRRASPRTGGRRQRAGDAGLSSTSWPGYTSSSAAGPPGSPGGRRAIVYAGTRASARPHLDAHAVRRRARRRGRRSRRPRGRVLPGHQAAGHVGDGPVRDHGVLPAAGDAVDLERRPRPQPLERADPARRAPRPARGRRGTRSRRTASRRSRGGARRPSSGMPS